MVLVDSHCHLNLITEREHNTDIATILAAARQKNIHYCLNVCINLMQAEAVLHTAKNHSGVGASVGVHPNEIEESADWGKRLFGLAQDPSVIAIGETGLDYAHKSILPMIQQERFRIHIRIAKQLNKPLIIHMRAAVADTLNILRIERADTVGGIFHCFTEGPDIAEQCMAMNFNIAFSGIVTFRNASSVQSTAQSIPLERLLIETDAPYLAPHPYRGQINVPAYLPYTAQFIANLRRVSLEEMADQTTKNFFELFPKVKPAHV